MGSVVKGIGNTLGLTEADSRYSPQVDGMMETFRQRADNPNGIATTAYKKMAQEGMGNALAGIAQTKGVRPSAQATMMDMTGSRMQGQIADQAGLMGLQEQQQNQNSLAQMLMKSQEMDLEKQQAAKNARAGFFGKALSAAGSMKWGKPPKGGDDE